MSTAVIGATGRVGSQIVCGLLALGDAVAALVRDPGKARGAFGEPGGLRIRPTRLDDPRDLTAALDGIRTVLSSSARTSSVSPSAMRRRAASRRWRSSQVNSLVNSSRITGPAFLLVTSRRRRAAGGCRSARRDGSCTTRGGGLLFDVGYQPGGSLQMRPTIEYPAVRERPQWRLLCGH